jgi:hypothetical protein
MTPDSYKSHKGLASVYIQLGRLDEALEEAKTARDLAPEEERPEFDRSIGGPEGMNKRGPRSLRASILLRELFLAQRRFGCQASLPMPIEHYGD